MVIIEAETRTHATDSNDNGAIQWSKRGWQYSLDALKEYGQTPHGQNRINTQTSFNVYKMIRDGVIGLGRFVDNNQTNGQEVNWVWLSKPALIDNTQSQFSN